MPTPFESAQLILKLFELRRDPVLREARQWFLADFNPVTYEECAAIISSPRNPSFRMVISYWDMAASLVSHGAIDADMFRAAGAAPQAIPQCGQGARGGRAATDFLR